METLSVMVEWAYRVVATWYVAAIVGGVLIFAAEQLARRREPSDADVRRAAERYQQWYGTEALSAIGDHMLAASFAPDSRYRRFLKRVHAEVIRRVVTDEDRKLAIENSEQAKCRLPRQH
jgi:hypothetical protein